MVLNTLPEEKLKKNHSALQVSRKSISFNEFQIKEFLLEAIQATEDQRGMWDAVTLFVAACNGNYYVPVEDGFVRLLLEAAEADRGSKQSRKETLGILQTLLREVELCEYSDAKDAVLHEWAGYLDYLLDLWGDKTPDFLAQVTGTKPATTASWLEGQSSTRANRYKIRVCAQTLYDLQHQIGWDPEKITQWCQKPLSDKSTPLDHLHTHCWYSEVFEKELKSIGLEE